MSADRVPPTPDEGTRDATDRLLATLLEQEARLQLDAFDLDAGWALGHQVVQAARDQQLGVTVSVRWGRQRVFHAALPGTSADNDRWLERKRRVVEHFGHSSFYVGTLFRSQGRDFATSSGLDPLRYAAHGSAVPLQIRGAGTVGSIGVSGLAQALDHAFVVQQLELFVAGPDR